MSWKNGITPLPLSLPRAFCKERFWTRIKFDVCVNRQPHYHYYIVSIYSIQCYLWVCSANLDLSRQAFQCAFVLQEIAEEGDDNYLDRQLLFS